MRVGERGREVPVAVVGPAALDARSVTDDFHPDFFARGGPSALAQAADAGRLPPMDIAGLRVGAPVARPAAVICIGQNYAAHAAESGAPAPAQPIVFFKHPNTLCGPNDPVPIPPGATKVDWEVELAVVIGAEARYVDSLEAALAYVAGYTVCNDVSERDFQLARSGGQWSKGKCCEGFAPMGPWLSVDEIDDPQALGLRSWVGGEVRQHSNTADMVFSVAEIIRDLSHFMVLSPGDVINTGTPEGVALSGRFEYLRPGDVVELEIDGLGRQRQRFV